MQIIKQINYKITANSMTGRFYGSRALDLVFICVWMRIHKYTVMCMCVCAGVHTYPLDYRMNGPDGIDQKRWLAVLAKHITIFIYKILQSRPHIS